MRAQRTEDELQPGGARFDPVAEATELISGFRRHFLRLGYRERERQTLVSHHDSSIRFTNSTISVFKADLVGPRPVEPLLLVQPALRLRNLAQWKQHETVSDFGCYFVAFGTLSPPGSLPVVQESVISWMREVVGVAPDRLVVRGSSRDPDLLDAAAATGTILEVDGYAQQRYRHVFGLDGVRGRNTNLAIRTTAGLQDVCNVIAIEREDGTPLAVETAFGVSTVLSRAHDLAHVLLASAAAEGATEPVDLMAVDAAGSAIALLSEGLRPRARGRAGNLRTLLTVLAERVADLGWSRSDVLTWIRSAVAAEYRIREQLSPPVATAASVPPQEAVRQVERWLYPSD